MKKFIGFKAEKICSKKTKPANENKGKGILKDLQRGTLYGYLSDPAIA